MQTWVIGNWKQNPATIDEVENLLNDIVSAMDEAGSNRSNNRANDQMQKCQLMVAPSFIHLATVSQRLQNSSILTAAQDIGAHSATTGAYTGDCSAQQLADAGASWTILGHSERRQYYKESNESLLKKLKAAFEQNLGVILCIGETQAQYDASQTSSVLDEQLAVLKNFIDQQSAPESTSESTSEPAAMQNLSERLLIAYEPVWAIGTGKVPTVEEVSATHKHIKNSVANFAKDLPAITVLYGGSVNAGNADSFATSSMIDGALVGGAALKADSFLAIAKAFEQK